MAQVDTIFADQGLPHLGFANDLLYIAAAIAPGVVQRHHLWQQRHVLHRRRVPGGATVIDADGDPITLTGYGYFAGPGYDLTTGLGSPNGVLLSRAMTAIAHSQMSYSSSPDMLDADWRRLDERRRPEPDVPDHVGLGGDGGVDIGTASLGFSSLPSGYLRLDQPAGAAGAAVRLRSSPGAPVRQAGAGLGRRNPSSRRANSCRSRSTPQSTVALQASLTSPFDFADFTSAGGAVRVARPVAVAETAGAADDTVAIVRVRQNGEDSLSLTFYRVDDLAGTIGGMSAGQTGYAAAAQARAYQLTTGGTSLGGPGYGNYGQIRFDERRCRRFHRHEARRQHHRRPPTGPSPTPTRSWRPVGRPSVELRAEHLGLGRHVRRRRSRLQRPRCPLDFTSASGHGWLV